ncbi:MAG: ATP-binding protein [Bacteroidetes bacterium]|nr:ATP-binding protein [Bacteroidota bacterium]
MTKLQKHTSSLVIHSQTHRLKEVREFVAEQAQLHGFKEDDINKIVIAVDEACTNIIKHGYRFAENETIEIQINRNGNEFEILITDHGKKFDPSSVAVPDMQEYLSHYHRGGLGIYLMKRIMDKVEFSFQQKTNTLRLVKYL